MLILSDMLKYFIMKCHFETPHPISFMFEMSSISYSLGIHIHGMGTAKEYVGSLGMGGRVGGWGNSIGILKWGTVAWGKHGI